MAAPLRRSPGALRYWKEGARGGFVPARSLPLTDRGFRYGMAVFETIAVHAGRPLFVAEHFERLAEACRKFAFPVAAARLAAAEAFLVEAARGGRSRAVPPGGHGVVRVHVTAGDGAPLEPALACRIFLSWESRQPVDGQTRLQGLRLRLHPEPCQPAMGGMKTHNYWGNLQALASARSAGADEALLCDGRGRLISVCMGNIFLLAGGDLITPTLQTGARPGVVREWVMKHFATREQDIVLGDKPSLSNSVFLVTNSWSGPAVAVVKQANESVNYTIISMLCRKIVHRYDTDITTPCH